jgi:hypothetical protein
MFREYQFRTTFGLTHEEYLDEPVGVIEWLTQIDRLVKEL